jgi:tetratricopeptide (TPR) repeat protein
MKPVAFRSLSLALVLLTSFVCSDAQSRAPAPNYEDLIQQGKSQLQAGSAEQALASSKEAIKQSGTRWEGYALAGGALINLKRYEAAADTLAKAIELAPDTKQPALRDLRQQALLAQGNGSAVKSTESTPSGGPSYDQTVAYLSDKFQQAGKPGFTHVKAGTGGGMTTVDGGTKYSISVPSCNNMTITSINTQTYDDPHDEQSRYSKADDTITLVVPFSSVASVTAADNIVLIVAKDAGIKKSTMFTATNPRDSYDDTWVPTAGQNIELVAFQIPGTGETSTHVAKAIQHLMEICVNHPEQAPKEMF